MENEIFDTITKLLDDEFSDGKDYKIELSTNVADTFDLDSLSILELYLILETEFKISIPDEQRKMNVTVGDLVNLVKDRLVDD